MLNKFQELSVCVYSEELYTQVHGECLTTGQGSLSAARDEQVNESIQSLERSG